MDIELCIWLILCATGVLKGSDARFNATVLGKWEVMTWNVRGFLVLTVPRSGNISSSSEQFSASFCSADDASCVAFTIRNTSRMEAGPVICTVQGDYGSKSALLHVEESGTIQIKEGDMKVVQDEEVEFNCVTSAWFPSPVVSWNLNGDTVDSSHYNSTHAAHGDSFNSSSVLKFHAVKNSMVECLAMLQTLSNPLSTSVHFVVVPRPPDWTVLIAVVCSFGSFALVVLLILGIIFCYKRKKEKEPNYQDEMTKRVRTQSQSSGLRPPGHKQGRVNADYVTDGQTSIAPNDLTESNSFEMPDAVYYHQTENDYKTANNNADEGLRKHRHATTV
ncbi:immunoglobulin superfamily member 5 isoform X2 [Phyllopteryx taeniolatus]|uniref:immunoglobulin superfamily member 5 isoform X2 n=1 Tax=Phyllopteryx taeniolatus TaxID=161469 RepID=UPI002AD4CC80|nr:immunoglobulin superfamily member 5 isoform X2 [Phyllopteryx taeniolatus]